MAIRQRSISLPIVLATISVALSIALLVGWTVLLARYIDLTREVGAGVSFLVLGVVAFITICTIMILIVVFLVREILDSRRQIRFMDSVTHELKSPLASIRLSAETMARPSVTNEQRQKLREMTIRDIERLGTFIDDVLQASRLEMRSQPVERKRIDVHAFVSQHVDTVTRRYSREPESIRVRVDDGLTLRTDRAALYTIFSNILDNACKYSSADDVVDVRAFRDARGRFVLRVDDQGIGISSKEIKRVRRRFYRVPSVDVRARRGTGLGLYVVNGFAKRLGGKLVLASDGLGEGTSVTLTLPTDTVCRDMNAERSVPAEL